MHLADSALSVTDILFTLLVQVDDLPNYAIPQVLVKATEVD